MKNLNLIEMVEKIINKNDAYKIYGKYKNSINFRKEPLRGSFSVQIGYLATNVPVFIIEVTNKEEGNHFKDISKMMFFELLKGLNEQLTAPFLVSGAENNSFLLDMINVGHLENHFLNNTEKDLLSSDEWTFNWVIRNNDARFTNIFNSLMKIQSDFSDFTKYRKTKEQSDAHDYLFKPLRTFIFACGDRLSLGLKVEGAKIIADLTSPEIQLECDCLDIENPVLHLFEQFNDSMRLKWLLDKKTFPSAISLASVHCRGSIREDANNIQHAALSGDWNFDEIDMLFHLLSTDEFSNFIDNVGSKPKQVHKQEINGFNLTCEVSKDYWKITIKNETYVYWIQVKGGFPIKANDIVFGKEIV